MLLGALAAIAVAALGPNVETTTRDAPWQLTGISKDTRTLHLVYETGGCLENDGRAEADTSDPRTVKITVKQTAATGEYAICPAIIGAAPLDVDLGAPLAGRTVAAGPKMTFVSKPETLPNVVGLRRADAAAALKAQFIDTTTVGRKGGVVHHQFPGAGRRVPKGKVILSTGPFDVRARLAITVPPQTVESVLRRGLRFRYRVDPAVEKAVAAGVSCNGQDFGNDSWPVRRARATKTVEGGAIRLRKEMRRRATSRCRLDVYSYPRGARRLGDFFLRRTAKVTLTHR